MVQWRGVMWIAGNGFLDVRAEAVFVGVTFPLFAIVARDAAFGAKPVDAVAVDAERVHPFIGEAVGRGVGFESVVFVHAAGAFPGGHPHRAGLVEGDVIGPHIAESCAFSIGFPVVSPARTVTRGGVVGPLLAVKSGQAAAISGEPLVACFVDGDLVYALAHQAALGVFDRVQVEIFHGVEIVANDAALGEIGAG